jgi:hypothetical protein
MGKLLLLNVHSDRYGMRKNEQERPYPPDFVSAETLAYRLDCSLRCVQDYVKVGLLPDPIAVGNLIRWNWTVVQAHIEAHNAVGCEHNANKTDRDEYSADIRKALQSAPKAAND